MVLSISYQKSIHDFTAKLKLRVMEVWKGGEEDQIVYAKLCKLLSKVNMSKKSAEKCACACKRARKASA